VAALGAATTSLALRDPHHHGSWGICPSAAMGVYCPFCGGLRAVNDLTHGDVLAAASSNLMLVVALPFALVALGLWVSDAWRGTRRTIAVPVPAVWLVVALVVGFAVLRNIPGSWLAP
jgi:hypothetical protein